MKCRSCDRIKVILIGGQRYNCKTSGKICEAIDLRLAELMYEQNGKPSRLEDLLEASQKILEGHGRTKRHIDIKNYSYPNTAQDFIDLIGALHHSIFSESGLSFAGKFRDKEIKFGTGKNERVGTPPTNIHSELCQLYERIVPHSIEDLSLLEPTRFVRFCGIFLEEFFLTHPFLDGNGRVGRFLLNFFACHHGRFRFRTFSLNKKDSRNYRVALEFAHRHAEKRVLGEIKGDKPQDPLKLLVPWIGKHLTVVTLDEINEISPPD